MIMINLSELTNGKLKNLLGKERGVAGREYFQLDRLDDLDEKIQIFIPRDMESIAPSFFQGMFSKSVKKAGSPSAFLNKYVFDAESHILDWINIGIRDSLIERRNFLD